MSRGARPGYDGAMSELEHVFDGTRDNFRELVLGNSEKGVVLVNYWQPGAGPCLRLWQTLEPLVRAYRGRFLLVNVNTDSQKALAREQGIASVPTLKLYRGGEVRETVHGPESEARLLALLDRYVQPPPHPAVAEALRLYRGGDADAALQKLVEAVLKEPDNARLHATAVKLLLRERRYDDVEAYASVLPAEVRVQENIGVMQMHARLLKRAQLAQDEPALEQRLRDDPQDREAALDRAALALVRDDYETALALLLKLHRQDAGFDGGLPRKAMQAIFALLGEGHPLRRRFQAELLS